MYDIYMRLNTDLVPSARKGFRALGTCTWPPSLPTRSVGAKASGPVKRPRTDAPIGWPPHVTPRHKDAGRHALVVPLVRPGHPLGSLRRGPRGSRPKRALVGPDRQLKPVGVRGNAPARQPFIHYYY